MVAEDNELGAFLRARRGRLQPSQVGLPDTFGQRRTPGLRREELAALAGVSSNYYTRLEQGKERNPGVAVVEALARALQLDGDAHDHLRVLAALAAGRRVGPTGSDDRVVTPDIHGLINHLRPWPALVLSRTSDVLAANLEGLALFAGLADWPIGRRNTVRYVFTHPAGRGLFVDWERAAWTSVAGLRSRLALDPTAPDVRSLRDELLAVSDDFRRVWENHDVRPRRSETKLFRHPQIGTIALRHTTLRLADSRTRLSTYQPATAGFDENALRLLALDPANDNACVDKLSDG